MRKFALIAALLLAATAVQAEETIRHTVVIRDGKVIVDDGLPGLRRAFLGVAVTQLTPELREFFGAPKDAGVLISSLTANGPAAKAGARVGDVITSVNGQSVASHGDLLKALKDKRSGDSIRLDVVRGKARQTLMASAEERAGMELRNVFELPDLPNLDKFDKKEWHAFVVPDTDELRARIRDLESRLQELEKRLKEK